MSPQEIAMVISTTSCPRCNSAPGVGCFDRNGSPRPAHPRRISAAGIPRISVPKKPIDRTRLRHSNARTFWLEVWGDNAPFYDRLRKAGFQWHKDTKRWVLERITEQQAKSLAGRMRADGAKVLIHDNSRAGQANVRGNQLAPHEPTEYELNHLKLRARQKAQRIAENQRRGRKGGYKPKR